MKPLCFILLPSGRKSLPSGVTVDVDAVYWQIMAPAVEDAGLEPIRADQEAVGKIGHQSTHEHLMLCDFAVADLTGANANVFYALGLRQGLRPATTLLITTEPAKVPLDVALLRVLSYGLDDQGQPQDAPTCRASLTARLRAAVAQRGEASRVSAVFQLVENRFPSDVSRLKTDVFRERTQYAETARQQFEAARRSGKTAVQQVAAELGDLDHLEAGVLVDLLLSCRAVSDWPAMIDLVERLPAPVARSRLVQEQYALALNRSQRWAEAEALLKELIRCNGPNSETSSLLGRLYKDRWEEAVKAGDDVGAPGLLRQAIETYLQGFEADWRDAYPGINAVTLMELDAPPDPRRLDLLPVVAYAVKRRLAKGPPDYWDHATLLELAVLAEDEDAARRHASDALAVVREPWEPQTTARNLRLIREARAARGHALAWADALETALEKRAN